MASDQLAILDRRLENVKRAIAECTSASEAVKIRAQLTGIMSMARTLKVKDLEIFRQGERLHFANDVKLGQICAAMEKLAPQVKGGLRKGDTKNNLVSAKKAQLEKAGLTEMDASNLEALARYAEKHKREIRDAFKELAETTDKRKTLSGIVKRHMIDERRAERIADLGSPKLPPGKYNVILADPPWAFSNQSSGSRQIENQYPTMQTSEIQKLDIAALSLDVAALFLWVPASMLLDGLAVMESWGFEYKAQLIWVKDKIGMGYWVRSKHEPLLIGTRGNMPPPAASGRAESVIFSDRSAHSEKPLESYSIIERMFPEAKRIELFSRHRRPGWKQWGNEIDAD